MKTLLTLLAALVLLAVAGCGADDPGTSDPDTSDPDMPGDPFGGTVWQLTSGTVDGQELALLDTHPVTLAADPDGNIGGTSACNRYGGPYTVEPTSDGIHAITFGSMFMTEMACFPEEVGRLELAYLAALARVGSVATDADTLTLAGDGVELRFTTQVPDPDAALTDTTWVLDSLFSGDTASSAVSSTVSAAGSAQPTLVLADDGTVSGSTGCNRFTGTVVIDGDRFEPAALSSTRMACEPALMEQEQTVLAVLGGGPTWTIEGRTLTLRLADGSGLGYRADAAD